MDIEEKIELNKTIRKYTGGNNFIISIQNQLKASKTIEKVEYKGKMVKVLSDRQYDAVRGILNT